MANATRTVELKRELKCYYCERTFTGQAAAQGRSAHARAVHKNLPLHPTEGFLIKHGYKSIYKSIAEQQASQEPTKINGKTTPIKVKETLPDVPKIRINGTPEEMLMMDIQELELRLESYDIAAAQAALENLISTENERVTKLIAAETERVEKLKAERDELWLSKTVLFKALTSLRSKDSHSIDDTESEQMLKMHVK